MENTEGTSAEANFSPQTFDDLDTPPAAKPEPEKVVESVENATAEATEAVKDLAKTLKFKSGDKELDLPEDAVVFMPVNGELKEVKLSDLKTEVNGREYYHRKLSEVDAEKKLTQTEKAKVAADRAEIAEIDSRLQRLMKHVKAGDNFGALNEILAMDPTIDPAQHLQGYLNQSQAIAVKWQKMTPQEREAVIAQERAKRVQSDIKREKEKANQELTARELKLKEQEEQIHFVRHCNALQAEHGVSDDELKANWQELHEKGYFENKQIQSLNHMAEMVVDYIATDRLYTRVEDAIRGVDPRLESDEVAHKVARRVKLLEDEQNKPLSKSEITRIVSEVTGHKPAVSKNGEASRGTTTQHAVGTNGTPLKKEPTESAVPQTWDDL